MLSNISAKGRLNELHDGNVPFLGHMVIGVVMSCVTIIGLVFNGLIIHVFRRYTALNTPTNCFILALTVLDFVLSLFGLPMVVISSFATVWAFGDKGCVYYGFLMTFLGLSIISLLTMISVDRYIVIVKTHFKGTINRRIAVVIILACVLHGLLWALGPIFGWSSYTKENFGTSCAVRWDGKDSPDVSFNMMLLVICFCLPLTIIIFCYGSIYYKVRCDSLYRRKHYSAERRLLYDTDVAKTIFCMIFAFLVCWVPYALLAVWVVFGNPEGIPTPLTIIPTIFAKTSVIWNPLIYTYRNREVRKCMVDIWPFLANIFCLRERAAGRTVTEEANVDRTECRTRVLQAHQSLEPSTNEGVVSGLVNSEMPKQENEGNLFTTENSQGHSPIGIDKNVGNEENGNPILFIKKERSTRVVIETEQDLLSIQKSAYVNPTNACGIR